MGHEQRSGVQLATHDLEPSPNGSQRPLTEPLGASRKACHPYDRVGWPRLARIRFDEGTVMGDRVLESLASAREGTGSASRRLWVGFEHEATTTQPVRPSFVEHTMRELRRRPKRRARAFALQQVERPRTLVERALAEGRLRVAAHVYPSPAV